MKGHRTKSIANWIAIAVVSLLILSGILQLLTRHSGKLLVNFIENQATPYLLNAEDVQMGCVMSEAFSLVLPSLSEVNVSPYRLAVLFDFLAGSCAEFKAAEEELRYLRAERSKNILEAQDARILQKRYLNLAARRQLKGYYNLEQIFATKLGEECPLFNSEIEELYWLVGLMNGLQAVLNDLVSEGSANVPLDISHKVGRGANCLENEKWWGLPNAIQASLWANSLSMPPRNQDPLVILDKAVQTGLSQGVRVGQVIKAKIFIGLGDDTQVKEIIRENVSARKQFPSPKYAFLDRVATAKLLAISDYLWTEATGKRTPMGRMGTFWDDSAEEMDFVDLSDVL